MINRITDKQIIELWDDCTSVKSIARAFGVTRFRVTKALSTVGIIVNEKQKQILEYYAKGLSVKEIAKEVKLSEIVVKAYLPRKRPEYGINRSKNALAIERYRLRKSKNKGY